MNRVVRNDTGAVDALQVGAADGDRLRVGVAAIDDAGDVAFLADLEGGALAGARAGFGAQFLHLTHVLSP